MNPPAIAVCGLSGSGKTTLVEALLPRLRKLGLSVGVLKHDAHRLQLDTPGKDTARFWEAGAAVVAAHDPTQVFIRLNRQPNSIGELITAVPAALDLLIVEGHKASPLPKIWLGATGKGARPSPPVLASLAGKARLVERAEKAVLEWLHAQWDARPVGLAFMVGGGSSRMGAPKAMMDFGGRPLLSVLVDRLGGCVDSEPVLVGDGPVPPDLAGRTKCLPDAPGLAGPVAGIVSLLKWADSRAWIVLAIDMPAMKPAYLRWLMRQRKPGVWAVMPRRRKGVKAEPLAAVYEPQSTGHLLKSYETKQMSVRKLLRWPKARRPVVPKQLSCCLQNVNTPPQWRRFLEEGARR